MCGRYLLIAVPEAVRRLFAYAERPNFPPRYNIAPTQPIPIVIDRSGERRFLLVRWGFLPAWVADPKGFPLLYNARAETAADKASFRAAMRHRRCLVPASGFYEWRATPQGRQPFLFRPRHGGVIGFAGLWETWSSADGSEIDTAAILTVPANRLVAPIYDRMPAVIAPEHHAAWLDTMHVDAEAAARLLVPAADDFFEAVPVGARVNKATNDDPGLIEPLSEALVVDPPAAPDPAPSPAPAEEPAPAEPAPARRRRRAGSGQLDLF